MPNTPIREFTQIWYGVVWSHPVWMMAALRKDTPCAIERRDVMKVESRPSGLICMRGPVTTRCAHVEQHPFEFVDVCL